jgi:hypothetical protein
METSKGTRPARRSDEIDRWSQAAAERLAPTVQRALTDKAHWLHRDYTERLTKFVSGNEAIPQSYKDRLPKDIAEVLRVTPDALGLVKEATIRGQRNPLASRGKLGTGTGSVYEIMGSAAIIRSGSTAGNTGIRLHITPGRDRLDFGIKLQSSYHDDERQLTINRRSNEADALIYRPGGREVAIDFKHAMNQGPVSDKGVLKSQVAGVVNALRTEEIHEFHFVTNGHFTKGAKGFMAVIDEANKLLTEEGRTPISCHDHVF